MPKMRERAHLHVDFSGRSSGARHGISILSGLGTANQVSRPPRRNRFIDFKSAAFDSGTCGVCQSCVKVVPGPIPF
eukprot:3708497-Pleurochrysis_carterae.AAC.2